ncbi:phosphoesterase, MJ0936 family [Xaviernesmea oryzae]|nr:phosphoesterase, MJ0936 family [Xaviernesmea oryzae]
MSPVQRIAVLADIHGNLMALDAVLADIDGQGISEIVNLGDHLSGPLDPAGTAERLMQRPMSAIAGNHDQYLLTLAPDAMGLSDRFAHASLTPAHRAWLGSLPATRQSGALFLCHGTPLSDETYLLEEVVGDHQVIARGAGAVDALIGELEADILLCGHSHQPRLMRLPNGRLVLNPGSVGCPAYQDETPYPHRMECGHAMASYAVIERRGTAVDIAFRHVAYDHLAAAALAERNGRPDWAEALRSGRIGRGG